MSIIRPQRDAIESILPEKARCCLGAWVGIPPNPNLVKFVLENETPLHFLGLNRPNKGFGFNKISVPVFGLGPPKKNVLAEDWKDLLESVGAVLLSSSGTGEQVELLEKVFPSPEAFVFCFQKTGRVAEYPVLITS